MRIINKRNDAPNIGRSKIRHILSDIEVSSSVKTWDIDKRTEWCHLDTLQTHLYIYPVVRSRDFSRNSARETYPKVQNWIIQLYHRHKGRIDMFDVLDVRSSNCHPCPSTSFREYIINAIGLGSSFLNVMDIITSCVGITVDWWARWTSKVVQLARHGDWWERRNQQRKEIIISMDTVASGFHKDRTVALDCIGWPTRYSKYHKTLYFGKRSCMHSWQSFQKHCTIAPDGGNTILSWIKVFRNRIVNYTPTLSITTPRSRHLWFVERGSIVFLYIER